jgi:hypothetical protein
MLTVSKVALANLQLHAVAGSGQMVGVGRPFQPVVVRVTDSAPTPNPVGGATVTFALTEMLPDNDAYTGEMDDDTGGRNVMPVILGQSQTAVQSDVAGLAAITPVATRPGAVEIEIIATAGTAAVQQTEVESMWMITSWGSSSPQPGRQPSAGTSHPDRIFSRPRSLDEYQRTNSSRNPR